MKFSFRKSKTGFYNWYRYHIKEAERIRYAHEVIAPNEHLFHESEKDKIEEAIVILNQLESLKLSLTKIENRVFTEYLLNKKLIKDMSTNYLNQTIEMIYKKWVLICFPDESIYIKKITPQKLGVTLREIRLKKGYSVGAVCDQLKINESTLRNYELGNRLPKIDILHGIAQIYKISVDEIIDKVIR